MTIHMCRLNLYVSYHVLTIYATKQKQSLFQTPNLSPSDKQERGFVHLYKQHRLDAYFFLNERSIKCTITSHKRSNALCHASFAILGSVTQRHPSRTTKPKCGALGSNELIGHAYLSLAMSLFISKCVTTASLSEQCCVYIPEAAACRLSSDHFVCATGVAMALPCATTSSRARFKP